MKRILSAADVAMHLAADSSDPYAVVQTDFQGEMEGTVASLSWKIVQLKPKRGRRQAKIVLAIRKALDNSQIDVAAYEIFDFDIPPRRIVSMTGKKGNCFVRVTDGYLLIENPNMRGLGIGTVCFNEVIRWALINHPEELLHPIQVFEHLANEFPPDARDRWYRGFGFVFKYEEGRSHPKAQGESVNKYVKELNVKEQNIKQLPLLQFLSETEAAMKQAQKARDEAEDYIERHHAKVRALSYTTGVLFAALILSLMFNVGLLQSLFGA
jgi:GNAT superfamily N-acetyltransferase